MLTGKALRAAREAAAARYEALAAEHAPAGVTIQYRKSLSGRADYAEHRLQAPRPVTRRALHIFLHECAHFHLHAPGLPGAKHKRWLQEFEAERWAFAAMRAGGVPVPRKSLERAKAYVRRCFDKAQRRHIKGRLSPAEAEAARWAEIPL